MTKKIQTLLLLELLYFSFFTKAVNAVCPVCTIAVGAGLGISRALGIDDAVTSIWIGGLILSSSFWLLDYLKRKNYKFLRSPAGKVIGSKIFIFILMYSLFIIPLWFGKYIGRAGNDIWGIDKIIFGTEIGIIVFFLAKKLDEKVRKIKGKQLLVYQKVIFPVSGLLLTSIILHFII